MKILVTGAAGFVGSHLVEHLLASGVGVNELRLLVLRGDSLKNLPKKGFEIVYGDIRDKHSVKLATEGVDVIYHLAAMTVTRSGRYEDYRAVNVDGTKNLLEACRGKKIKKFVYFSSIAVYGLPAYVGEIKNWDETRPKEHAEDYGKTKFEAEKLVETYGRKFNIPYVIVRPTSVYGPRDYQNLAELYRAIRKRYFVKIGQGRNLMDYVYVKDLVKGARLAERGKKRAADYILGGGGPISFNEVIDSVSKSIGIKPWPFYVPKFVALPVSYLCYGLERLTGVAIPFFPNRVRVMTTTCYFSIKKAEKEIGYHPETSFTIGTQKTAQWLKEHGMV